MIIDKKLEDQLHQPLHATEHFLNLAISDNPRIGFGKEVNKGLFDCIQKLIPSHQMQDKIVFELSKYKMAEDLFGNPMVVRSRKTKAPG